jgi:SAM-dependent methyltransferase
MGSRPLRPVADVFETGEWPFGPRSHDTGWRLLLDTAIVGGLLAGRPGDRVLDLGAGAGFSTEVLVRFGYHVVALDPDHHALQLAMRRLSFDRRLHAEHAAGVAGLAERLPFTDRDFDGVVGMNVLHHVDDLEGAVKELARVVRPGGRVVLSEPGARHLEHLDTMRALREHGENDKPLDVRRVAALARANGFARVEIAPLAYRAFGPIDERDLESFARGDARSPQSQAATLAAYMVEYHPIFALVRTGSRALDSRRPGRLACTLDVEPLPRSVRAGEEVRVRVKAHNGGDTVWLAGPFDSGGFVTFGCKLTHPDGRVITDRLGRTTLERDVLPGEWTSAVLAITVPVQLAPGDYGVTFDMVDEWICWFGDADTAPLQSYALTVERST